MDRADQIRKHLKGGGREKKRREEILAEVLGAFDTSGPEAVSDRLAERMAALERAFGEALERLDEKL